MIKSLGYYIYYNIRLMFSYLGEWIEEQTPTKDGFPIDEREDGLPENQSLNSNVEGIRGDWGYPSIEDEV